MKAIDIVKPVCPHASNHRHLRKVFAAFPNAYISDNIVMLKVPHHHICQARVIIENIAQPH